MAVTTAAVIGGLIMAGASAAMAENAKDKQEDAAARQMELMQQQVMKVGDGKPTLVKESGMDRMDLMRSRAKRGRASTVKTGALVPPNIGYRSLLG